MLHTWAHEEIDALHSRPTCIMALSPTASSPLEVDASNLQTHTLANVPAGSPQEHIALYLADNNLRRRGGSEALCVALMSMLHRRFASLLYRSSSTAPNNTVLSSIDSYYSPPRTTGSSGGDPHGECRRVPPCVVELDLTRTGAFECIKDWCHYFESLETYATKVFADALEEKRPFCLGEMLRRLEVNEEPLGTRAHLPLLQRIGQCSSLTHLSLQQCLLCSESLCAVAEGIRGCHSSIEYINFSDNDITSKGLEALALALCETEPALRSIRILILDNNVVGWKDLTIRNAKQSQTIEYCRSGLLATAQLARLAPGLALVSLAGNLLGVECAGGARGVDHGGVSELCEGARRSISVRASRTRMTPPVIHLVGNEFSEQTKESLNRCSGYTATL